VQIVAPLTLASARRVGLGINSPRSGQNGPQNGPKKGHFQRNTLKGSDRPSVSVGTSKLS
jgi:hypothetical protein